MIAVCFPGGCGGHYVGYLCNQIMLGLETVEIPQSNFHSLFTPSQSFLNFSFLDSTGHSIEEEQHYIDSISPDSEIVIGHFRQINRISKKLNPLIVHIELNDTDVDLVVSRVETEVLTKNLNLIKYNDIKGDQWPEYNSDTIDQLPTWVRLEIKSLVYKMFYFWPQQVILPPDGNYCRLTTSDIFYGDAVTKIADYLKKPVTDSFYVLQKNYQQLVQQKYVK